MKTRTAILALVSVTAVIVGCGDGASTGPVSTAKPPPPPSFISPKKAANGGGAVVFDPGGPPAGSGFKTGPPQVGQKAGGN